ncbi:MAG: ribulose-phosphate 3-epimerase [Pseudothermotoga sp.]|jgi:ribulose-phosphate 3-epimerase|uniref:ribulose-phosphate 3-epimerase n=1 Tax=Pseudothermotoga TaxID=1643951 RepID=UPI000745F4D9|nr:MULTISPECIES: ribulose-phosphate 3-epimerase [Pseudothermotoga]KUK20888.1 MAG: Ribulose-phosphate 3-epimerase [Pseudothermotoga lettingae]MDI3494346.1 ribulose-phosphate 3-epimerase [Pseudothermotoga sp.]MDK2883645.1 ribulose-phosphate 3-epimerase [Pseudothermotoga sp.]HBJ82226.1 ribulose-phosphate 3-epimerase [Pseudothermotoga sp.]HBT25822.1 ribulose-phosphate 3-epimerase [Pseudothermotoga sp.]
MRMISASILASDLSRLSEEVKRVEPYIDMIHLDVMDGVFVPNITFGFPVLEAVRKCTDLPIDAHLMIINPEKYVERFIDLGASIIAVHYEACVHLHKVVYQIKDKGAQAYVALNPHTPIEMLSEILEDLDGVLIMTVNPGFSGQKFIQSSVEKIRKLSEMIQKKGLKTKIMVDGGINENTVEKVVCSGAEILVMGYGIFRSDFVSFKRKLEAIKCF